MAGIIILPPIGKCIENGKEINCNSCMYTIIDKLSWRLANDTEDGEWRNMILNGQSVKALEIIAEECLSENNLKVNTSDYYFIRKDNVLYLRCKKHTENKNKSILLSGIEEEGEKDFGTLGWNSNQNREIGDISSLGGSSFMVDAGMEGKYCISAWDWKNYTDNAAAEGDKTYGPSIIFYGGVYYYYPDGFLVKKSSANGSPLRYAFDTENTRKAAYCITIDTSSVLAGRFSTDSHEGSLLVENSELYIWQPKPSKSFSKGWIKIECESKKL